MKRILIFNLEHDEITIKDFKIQARATFLQWDNGLVFLFIHF